MEKEPQRQWGVTSAISAAHPTDNDLKLNDQLLETLKLQNNFESVEGTENRKKVLKHLQAVAEEFIRRASKAKNLPQSTIDNSGGKLYTFGSYALGVYGPSSDIDTLIVAPKHVYMNDFFDIFPDTFREMSDAKQLTEFNCVRDAYVPVINMEYCGVSIDLLFASLPSQSSIKPDLELTDKSLLRGLDDTAMRSVNGTRVTKELMESVPQVKSFRHALRAIKLWSNQRGIYGAVFGYPGGVAWAIMVARICQLYPFACGATILSKFFNLMLKWHWPRPVMLKSIEEGSIGLRVWNPQIYPQDRAHLMPIITPAFPSMCATHTIMHSTMDVMMKEFQRADEILHEIHTGKKKWDDLFTRHTFFTKDHKYYLSVIAATYGKTQQDAFSGMVKSKVRLLVKGIDDSDAGIDIARPYIKAFDRVHRCQNEDQIERVKQGSVEYQIKTEDLPEDYDDQKNQEKETFPKIIYTTTFYIGLTLPEGGTKSLDISYPVSEFKRYIALSDTYKEDDMSVRVVHTRNHQLPDDVFVEGEARPSKPAKEKKKKTSSKPSRSKGEKRQYTETGLDDSEKSAKRHQSDKANGLPAAVPA